MAFINNDQKYKNMYQVNKVITGYQYYCHLLEEKCLGMYEYEGLPDSLPEEQIESRLIWVGRNIVFEHKKEGLVVVSGGLSGVDKYYLPVYAVYAQPALGSGNFRIGKDCVVMYNSQIDQYEPVGLRDIIRRYARMLADIDSSINIATVNSRAQKMNVVNTQQTAKTVNEAMDSLYRGEPYTINQNSILDMYKTLDWFDTNKSTIISDLLVTRERLIGDFLTEIGVKSDFEKKERLITSEVSANDQLLTINVADMLKWRQKGVDQINKMFGTNIKVKRASAYELIKENDNVIREPRVSELPTATDSQSISE
jgi:hypothetical protein